MLLSFAKFQGLQFIVNSILSRAIESFSSWHLQTRVCLAFGFGLNLNESGLNRAFFVFVLTTLANSLDPKSGTFSPHDDPVLMHTK